MTLPYPVRAGLKTLGRVLVAGAAFAATLGLFEPENLRKIADALGPRWGPVAAALVVFVGAVHNAWNHRGPKPVNTRGLGLGPPV